MRCESVPGTGTVKPVRQADLAARNKRLCGAFAAAGGRSLPIDARRPHKGWAGIFSSTPTKKALATAKISLV